MNEEILQNLNQRLDDALDRGRQLMEDEDLERRLTELRERAERIIRRHPIKSIAAGLLAGYVLGKIFSSEDD